MGSWYVARTKPLKEQEGAATLASLGAETYVPLLRRVSRRAGRRELGPMFSGYLFARLDVSSDQWLMARSAPGIAYFLGNDSGPTPLPDGFIPSLRERVETTNKSGGPPRFQPGQPVMITHGPFQYLEALFDRTLTSDGRARVLVQIVGRLVPTDLFERDLKAI
jgi:transcription antitermination factor NusG